MEKVDKFSGKLGELALLPGGRGGGSEAGLAHRITYLESAVFLGSREAQRGQRSESLGLASNKGPT